MENIFEGQDADIAAVFEVDGEPAVVINGLPAIVPFKEPPNRDANCDMRQADDPFFGKLLIGRRVLKLFGAQYYFGQVVKYDAEVNWYRLVYEDGDSEELEWHELEELLLPLDVNIPVKLLPFQNCFHDEYFSKSKISMTSK